MRFVGLALHDPVPDAKTIWLFREQLTRAGAVERLFARFDRALRGQGLLAMGGQILDATIVQARPARLTAEEKASIRGGGTPAGWSPARRAQIDRDAPLDPEARPQAPAAGGRHQPAAGGRDRRADVRLQEPCRHRPRHGLIRTWTVTHAAAHDGGQLERLLDTDNTASGVWADTAYRSAANLAVLAKRAMVPHLQRPKPRGKPMPPNIRRGNATRGKVRAAVEHVFAAQKQRLKLVVRTVGIARATTKLGLANLAYNLLRFTWLEGRTAPASSPPKAAHQWSSRPRRQSGPKPPGSSPSPQLHSPRPITQPAQSAAIRGVRKTPRCLKSAAPLASGASAG